jgi:DNA-binding HxlR family transcriptional regulator
VELIGRRWSGVIVRALLGGPRHFNALLALIPGLSDRLLTERLRELEGAGVVARRVLAGRPVRVAYELTAAGRALGPVVIALADWAEAWLPRDGGPARPALADPGAAARG